MGLVCLDVPANGDARTAAHGREDKDSTRRNDGVPDMRTLGCLRARWGPLGDVDGPAKCIVPDHDHQRFDLHHTHPSSRGRMGPRSPPFR